MLSTNGYLVEGGQECSEWREESNMQLDRVCQLGEGSQLPVWILPSPASR